MDSDRKDGTGTKRRPAARLNATKRRMIKEIEDSGGVCWVTKGREIENYMTTELWSKVCGKAIPNIGEYDDIMENSAIKTILKGDKVDAAHRSTQLMESSDLDWLDLKERISELVFSIRKWNNVL
jgi:hypothetical protein